MKRVFSVLMLAVLLVSVLGISAKPASAAGLINYVDGRFIWGKGVVFIFEASGYRNRDVKGSDIFVHSSFYDLGCTVNREDGLIICVAPGGLTDYAGQTGIIYLAGQIFYVTIPPRTVPEEAPVVVDETPVCEEGTSLGATVTFETGGGDTYQMFILGSSIAEVLANAESWVDGSDLVGILSVGDLECGAEEQF